MPDTPTDADRDLAQALVEYTGCSEEQALEAAMVMRIHAEETVKLLDKARGQDTL